MDGEGDEMSGSGGCVRICLWSGPRNISTAMMYSFAQRSDTRVVDEPLYAHYLARTDARRYHPGAKEVLKAQNPNGEAVVRDVILGPSDRPILFLKQMTHHLVELDRSFLSRTRNVILTRDPRDMLPSYAEQVDRPALEDTGYPQSVELLYELRALGQDPPVVEAREVLRDPRRILGALCDRLGIPFEEAMLRWSPGARPEDGVWASHWYASVHRSRGFSPYRPKAGPFPGELRPLLRQCLPLYEELARQAIR